MLFDEVACRKKWTYVSKNTSKALKDQGMNSAYWNILNHVPKSSVAGIVTKSVLRMDKRSCDNLLNAIFLDKLEEDARKKIIQ